jgi:hypothetical protein
MPTADHAQALSASQLALSCFCVQSSFSTHAPEGHWVLAGQSMPSATHLQLESEEQVD